MTPAKLLQMQEGQNRDKGLIPGTKFSDLLDKMLPADFKIALWIEPCPKNGVRPALTIGWANYVICPPNRESGRR